MTNVHCVRITNEARIALDKLVQRSPNKKIIDIISDLIIAKAKTLKPIKKDLKKTATKKVCVNLNKKKVAKK